MKIAGMLLLAGLPLATDAAERWFLMARHGECMEIETAKRRIPGLTDDPHSFAQAMRQQGHAATAVEVPGAQGRAVEVRVPERNLGMVFVTRPMCREFIKR